MTRTACQLFVAKLSIASGSGDPTCILPVVAEADAALSAYGYSTKPDGVVKDMLDLLAKQLKYWNHHHSNCMS